MKIIHRKHFASVAELCAEAPSKKNEEPWQSTLLRCSENIALRGADWLGVPTMDDVMRVNERGWPEGAARVAELAAQDVPPPIRLTRKAVRGDHGDELDIHAVYAGHYDTAWRRQARRQRHGVRVITIAARIGAAFKVTSEHMFWRGAAICRLSDALSDAGYAVRIVGVSTSSNHDGRDAEDCIGLTVDIKAPDQPLNIQSLAVTVALSGFHRYYIFKARCGSPLRAKDPGQSQSEDADDLAQQLAREMGAEITISTYIDTKAKADAWVMEQIARIEAGDLAAA